MKMFEENGVIFILKEGRLIYVIDENEKQCGSKEFEHWVSLKGLQWEEF